MSFGENERDKVSLPTHRLCSHYNSYAALETMQGSVTSLTLTALLCLGPCWGHWNQVQTGTLPKPSIWADPGPIIAMGSPVTIWCLGPLDADGYYSLYKERISQPWGMKASLDSKYKASFLINKSMDIHQSGWFQCAYHSSSGWSEWSDPLLLVTEAADTTSPSKHKPDFKSASNSQDYTVENLIRMGMAVLVLVVLGVLLYQSKKSQRSPLDATRS
ncbi:leukocyte immunoglobulin-like receptor subfamily A member 5 isoform X5 [Loxodonta africana]|uniref:leukocyte immunoglobulin-like receptor subfamily A member 5 isoform X5 n=1 Tax=Loxodonta africana TaxID=9785 RepID=UPI0030CE3B03